MPRLLRRTPQNYGYDTVLLKNPGNYPFLSSSKKGEKYRATWVHRFRRFIRSLSSALSNTMNSAPVRYSPSVPIVAFGNRYEPVKRMFDAVIAAVLLLLLAPLMLLLAALVCMDSPGGALFRQERVGKNGATFFLFKFRSMRRGTPDLSTAEMRGREQSPVTGMGRFLRRTSLDELPQLFNVLIGQMSLVGPRPALPSQTQLNEMRRKAGVEALRPGITGWAQINGRDELTDAQKAAHDAYYRHHYSLALDSTILLRTVASVITGRGNR